jgi:hypothetical protein
MRRQSLLLSAAVLVAAASCVTVNIYFPAPAVRDAAEQIAEETWGEGQALDGAALSVSTRVLAAAVSALSPAEAHAAEPDINVSTAAIRALKQAMASRATTLRPWLDGGQIGVDATGELEVRDFSGVALPDQAKARRMIDAENRDRSRLYSEIATANNYGGDRVSDISGIFAQTWGDQARRSGWWTKGKSGGWKAP